jgi:hypothetical protein
VVELTEILPLPDGTEKTAALVAWIQDLFPEQETPILVGGAVVELLTEGAYTTGDLDFVGSVTAGAAARLGEAGFERKGRHWVHPEGELFVEFPAGSLDPAEGSVTLEVAGQRLLVLAPEAVIVDRLAAWLHWGSSTDAVNAFLVYRATLAQLDRRRLMRLVEERQVGEAWSSLEAFVGRLAGGSPSAENLERWAEHRES